MCVKSLVIAFLILVGSAYADGSPEYLVRDDGVKVPYETVEIEREKVQVVKGSSSYQRLKNKYEAEVKYSDELKERILAVQMDMLEKDYALQACKGRPPMPTEIIREKRDIGLDIFIFIIGLTVGMVL